MKNIYLRNVKIFFILETPAFEDNDILICSGWFENFYPSLRMDNDGCAVSFSVPEDNYSDCISFKENNNQDHPEALYYARVCNDVMAGYGIFKDDIVVVDRAIEPEVGDIVAVCADGRFIMQRFDNYFLNDVIERTENVDVAGVSVWGSIICVFRCMRKSLKDS